MSTNSENLGSKADFLRLVEEGRELNSAALSAELQATTALSEGLEATRAELSKLYELCHFLKQQDEVTRQKLFANQKYIDAVGDEKVVPYGKPAREKPEVPAAKIIMQRRDAGTLSKASLICRAAIDEKVLPAQFSTWLMKEHTDRSDGSITGRGIEGAYKAYRTRRTSTGNRVSSGAAALSSTHADTPTEDQIEQLIREAFKPGLTTKWELKVPREIVHHQVYSVLVRIQGPGLVTLVPDRAPMQFLVERLQNVIEQQKIKPADWKAIASGAAGDEPADAPLVDSNIQAKVGAA